MSIHTHIEQNWESNFAKLYRFWKIDIIKSHRTIIVAIVTNIIDGLQDEIFIVYYND